MQAIWSQIERWLQRADPAALAELRGPATNRHINHLEDTAGVRLPADMEASYKVHDGSWRLRLFPEGSLMSIQAIEYEWGVWHELLQSGELSTTPSVPEGPIQPVNWNPRWVPLTNSGSGDHFCVDLDPAEGGKVGQIIWFHHELGPVKVVANSFAEWMQQFADDLGSGQYRYDSHFEIVRC